VIINAGESRHSLPNFKMVRTLTELLNLQSAAAPAMHTLMIAYEHSLIMSSTANRAYSAKGTEGAEVSYNSAAVVNTVTLEVLAAKWSSTKQQRLNSYNVGAIAI